MKSQPPKEPVTCRTCRFCSRGYCSIKAQVLADIDHRHNCRLHREKRS